MSVAPPLPYQTLVDLARSGPALALPFETRQSYPIPVRRPAGLGVVFVYSPQGRANPVEGLHLIAPTFVAELDAHTGKLDSLHKLPPESLEAGHTPGQDIGAHTMPAGLTYDTFKAAEKQMFDDFDIVLPLFASGAQSAPPEARAAAAELLQLFQRLSEAPLAPYYRSIGKDFFAWTAAIAA